MTASPARRYRAKDPAPFTNQLVRRTVLNGTYAPAVGPFRLAVVFGGAAESLGGQCAEHTFPVGNCATGGGGKEIKCK